MSVPKQFRSLSTWPPLTLCPLVAALARRSWLPQTATGIQTRNHAGSLLTPILENPLNSQLPFHRLALILSLAMGACGSDGDGGDSPDAGISNITCSVSSDVEVDNSGILTGSGLVTCDGQAVSIAIETCIQNSSGGEFSDVLCSSGELSNVGRSEKSVQVNCSVSLRTFRTVTNARVNGEELEVALSSEVRCDG